MVYHFFPEERKIKRYAAHIKALKQALNHRLMLNKVRRVIKLNEKACLKWKNIGINTKLRKEAKKGFEKGSFKLMNISSFGTTMETVRSIETLSL